MADSGCPLECFMVDVSLLSLLAFMISLWQRTLKLQSFGSSCFWVFHCFAMDSKELSSISDCFGDQKAIKTPKLNIIWLELIARVLNMLIGLKDDNYYSKVFKRINHKLSNNTFWVVIIFVKDHILSNQPWQFNIIFYEHVWSITSLSFMSFVIDYILSNWS